jgi:hypothetical protein
LRCG